MRKGPCTLQSPLHIGTQRSAWCIVDPQVFFKVYELKKLILHSLNEGKQMATFQDPV